VPLLGERHDSQHRPVVTEELDVSLARGPDGANAHELELSPDEIADKRQQRFAGRLSI
jgi:hypothetical protein